MRNCPIDCASIYYNGVRRSGLYTVVPSLGVMPVEVYCDMETEGEGYIHSQVSHMNRVGLWFEEPVLSVNNISS